MYTDLEDKLTKKYYREIVEKHYYRQKKNMNSLQILH